MHYKWEFEHTDRLGHKYRTYTGKIQRCLGEKTSPKGFVLEHNVSEIGKIACYGLEDKKSNNEEKDKDEG